jgi:hypothetical protein
MFRKYKRQFFNFILYLPKLSPLERMLPKQQMVHQNPKSPHINGVRMPLHLHNLWRQIVNRANMSILSLPLKLNPSSQPKINQLRRHILIQAYITGLDIPMYNTLAMQILHRLSDWLQKGLDLDFEESSSSFLEVLESFVGAELEEDDYCASWFVLEHVVELDDVWVADFAVDLDLA